MTPNQYILGIDIGTSSVKAGMFHPSSGAISHVAAESYTNETEYDPAELWASTALAARRCVESLGASGSVSAIGVTGQMHGAVLYDDAGQVIPPLINWRDRHHCEQAILTRAAALAGDEITRSLGARLACGFTGAILLWFKKYRPEVFARVHHFALFTDFIRANLLGAPDAATDPTNAAGSGLFNTRLNTWHSDLIRQLGLPAAIFPRIEPSASIAGGLCAAAASQLGLPAGIPIVYGGGDNQASLTGSGLVAPSPNALINIGTAAQVSCVAAQFGQFPGVDTRPFFGGRFALVGVSLGGGGHYKRLRDALGSDYASLDRLAASAPAGAGGLYYCTGPSRTNPGRRSGFFGDLARRDDPGCHARAVLEGVLMDLVEPFGLMTGSQPGGLLIGAGRALQVSATWSQIAAEMFGRTLRITLGENAILGAALLAATGTGQLTALDACPAAFGYAPDIAPLPANQAFYRETFAPAWARLAAL